MDRPVQLSGDAEVYRGTLVTVMATILRQNAFDH